MPDKYPMSILKTWLNFSQFYTV